MRLQRSLPALPHLICEHRVGIRSGCSGWWLKLTSPRKRIEIVFTTDTSFVCPGFHLIPYAIILLMMIILVFSVLIF